MLRYCGWSFRFCNLAEPQRVIDCGDEVLLHGTVANNGLRLGTVYIAVEICGAYDHSVPVFDSDRDLPDIERHALRLVDIKPGHQSAFAIKWKVPIGLLSGVYDVRFHAWSPPMLFRKRTILDYPFEFARSSWFGWLDLIPRSDAPRPTAFISYSWITEESNDHATWVRTFAAELSRHGIKVVVDIYALRVGDQVRRFALAGREQCDALILICSQNYTQKANRLGADGVGVETQVFSEQPFFSQNQHRFIPIIRDNDLPPQSRLPVYLSDGIWLDFGGNFEWRGKPLADLVSRIREIAISRAAM